MMKTLCASLIQALQEDLSEEVADVYCHSLTLLILLIDNIQSGGVFTAKAGVNVRVSGGIKGRLSRRYKSFRNGVNVERNA